jgi:diguanylate cyclase (GGDEF)-like protein
MIVSMLNDGYLNDGFDELKAMNPSSWHELLVRRDRVLGFHIGTVLAGKQMKLEISHKGRVRLSELMQQIKTGRDRDPTGLLLAKRHLLPDLAIAILYASEATPLSVAFLDMNGLKLINDTHGHDAGDHAIRAFFQAVIATLGEIGEAYLNGGDEVVVILPNVADEQAGKLLDAFVRELGKDTLSLGKGLVSTTLTASCGAASTVNPNDDAKAFLDRADAAQYRAKDVSKTHSPRVSACAVGEGTPTTYSPASEQGAAPAAGG